MGGWRPQVGRSRLEFGVPKPAIHSSPGQEFRRLQLRPEVALAEWQLWVGEENAGEHSATSDEKIGNR
jgi:hypothetical protein